MNGTTPTTSSNPLPGRRFEPIGELALLPTAVRAAERVHFGPPKKLWLITEMKAPFGVPDLVAVLGKEEAFGRRLECPVPAILNQIDAGVVASLSASRPRPIHEVCIRTGWELGSVERRLRTLLRTGAVRENRSGGLTRHPGLSVWGRAIAVETKLTDWKGALAQCRKYLSWAETYVLVMDHVAAAAVNNLAANVRADHAGLLIDDVWIVRPTAKAQTAQRRFWTCEHAYNALRPSDRQSE